MKRKLGLIVSTIFCVFSVLCVPILVQAEEQEGLQTATENTYFEGQLNEKALKFYTAMEELNTKEDGFKTGKGEVELSETLGQDLLRAYVGGDPALAKDFQAARDAFTQDHEEIFYVDFTKLTFRVGMQNGAYVAFINNGSNENYYAAGFASAEDVDAGITAAAAEKKKIIDSVNKKIESQPGKISVEETVARVHEEVIKRMDYEHFTKENSKVAGVYGALVHQKGNCEGYSKSMKWILDDLGIPSILVSGTGVNSRGDKEALPRQKFGRT